MPSEVAVQKRHVKLFNFSHLVLFLNGEFFPYCPSVKSDRKLSRYAPQAGDRDGTLRDPPEAAATEAENLDRVLYGKCIILSGKQRNVEWFLMKMFKVM